MVMWKEITSQVRWALPVWGVTLLTSWLPDNRQTLRVRGALISMFVRSCGKRLSVGRDVTLLNTEHLTIGHDCYFAKGTWINAMGGVTIEDEVITSPYVVIASSNHGFRDGSVRFGGAHPSPVRIGRGTWLASHSVVTAGVSVGSGCLVGANAVVVADAPQNTVLGGVPAKAIKDRTDNPSEITKKGQIRV